MKKKIAGLISCFMALNILLAGCSGSDGSEEQNAGNGAGYEGTELTIGVEAGAPNIEFFEEHADEFTEKTGIKVEWVEIPHDNMHERFVQEAISQSGAIDIYDTDQPWISEFASKGYLEPLGDRITDEDRADFYEAALDASSYKD